MILAKYIIHIFCNPLNILIYRNIGPNPYFCIEIFFIRRARVLWFNKINALQFYV